MKKKMILAGTAVLLLAVILVCVVSRSGKTNQVQRVITMSSGVYTEAEVRDAMDVVESHFRRNFEGCSLLRLEYNEGKTLSELHYCAEQYDVDRVMILESDYYVGNHAEGCFTPDHTYKGWKWILTDDGNGWELRSSGYA